MIDRFTFYDVETTGLETRFDVPTQFAAIHTDGDLNPTGEIELRGRPPKHVLPAPAALVTTGMRISDVQNAPLSFYDLMSKIGREISQGQSSCYCAFNGLRYDEEILRHSFYQTLRMPYVTQLGGNTRGDTMKLFQAVHNLQPGQLVVPENNGGRLTFKLGELAGANGVAGHQAHDAMGDVRAMLELVRLVRKNAIEVWRMLPTWTDKSAVADVLSNTQVVLMADWLGRWGRPLIKSLHPVCPNPVYPSEWALIDLSVDPALYLQKSAEDLLEAMMARSGPKPVVRIKTNAMPIILPGDHVLAGDRHPVDAETREARVRALSASSDFSERVAEAIKLYRESFGEPYYVEQQLYSGGFFPTKKDQTLFDQFHSAKQNDRPGIVERMDDPRARELGRRLILNEWPGTLNEDAHHEVRLDIESRLTTEEKVPWMTVQKALEEIRRLRESPNHTASGILDEYEIELLRRFPQPIAAE